MWARSRISWSTFYLLSFNGIEVVINNIKLIHLSLTPLPSLAVAWLKLHPQRAPTSPVGSPWYQGAGSVRKIPRKDHIMSLSVCNPTNSRLFVHSSHRAIPNYSPHCRCQCGPVALGRGGDIFVPRVYRFLRNQLLVSSTYQSLGGFGMLPSQPISLFSSAFCSLAAVSLLTPLGVSSQAPLGQFFIWLCGSSLAVSGRWSCSLCNMVLGGS